jgi:hypothetical protein
MKVRFDWRPLLVIFAALLVMCLAPGTAGAVPASARTASIEPLVQASAGIECAVVSCNKGSSPASSSVPAVALAGVLAGLSLLVPLVISRRRLPTRTTPLASAAPRRLLRPPQGLTPA